MKAMGFSQPTNEDIGYHTHSSNALVVPSKQSTRTLGRYVSVFELLLLLLLLEAAAAAMSEAMLDDRVGDVMVDEAVVVA